MFPPHTPPPPPIAARALTVRHADARQLADALRDAAVQPGTQWSTRQAHTLALHTLCVRLIDEPRLTPGLGYPSATTRAFVAKLRWRAVLCPETCGDAFGLLDEGLAAILEGASSVLEPDDDDRDERAGDACGSWCGGCGRCS